MADSSSLCGISEGLVCGMDGPLRKLGNIESATINISSQILGTENRFHTENKTCTRVAIQNVDIALTLLCSKDMNLRQGLYSSKYEGEAAEDYVQDFQLCDEDSLEECNFFKFEKFGIDLNSVTVVILDEDNEVLATLVEETDFTVSDHGITILQDLFYTGQVSMRVTYDYDDTSVQEFDFLTQFQGHKYLYFKGTNYNDGTSTNAVGVEIYRALFNPVSQLDLISNGNYFVINLIGRIEKDYSKEEDNLGSYFKLRRL